MYKFGNTEYKLLFLDTNAIREIVLDQNNARKGFFKLAFEGPVKCASCFSFYNVIELMPYQDIFQKFLEFFSVIPCLMIFPEKSILNREYMQYSSRTEAFSWVGIANAFTPVVNNDSYNFRLFLERGLTEELVRIIKKEICEYPEVAKAWEEQRMDAQENLGQINLKKDKINDSLFLFYETDAIQKDIVARGMQPIEDIDVSRFPSLRIIEYSQFSRVHLTKKAIKPNDVMDVEISGIIPYVDAVITEAFQADVYKKAKRIVRQMKNLEIYTLKDIRQPK